MGDATNSVCSVLLVTTELRAGGTERCVTQLACHLDPSRYATRVVSIAPLPTERTQFLAALAARQVPVDSLQAGQSWQFPAARRRLKHLIQTHRPQVVLSFLFHANVLVGLCLKGQAPPAHLANIRVADPRRWRLPVERRSLAAAKQILCVSESVRDYCRQVGRFPADKLVVIPNGVDVADVDHQLHSAVAAAAPVATAGPHIGFSGRLDHQKGLDLLLEVWPKLLEAYPAARLWIAGAGPQQSRLQTMAQELGLQDQIEWLGWRKEPWAALAHCQALVFPSRWEGMSNSLLEAMATQKPVVAFGIEGVRETLGQGPSCQLAPPGDAPQFIEQLAQILGDIGLAKQAGDSNRRIIEQQFTLDAMIARFSAQIDAAV